MLYVFFGKDGVKVRERAFAHIRKMAGSDIKVTKITAEEYVEGMLPDLAQGTSLFGGEEVILLDTPSSDSVFAEAVEHGIEMLKDSANHFVITEKHLLVGPKKMYGKHAEVMEEIASEAEEKPNNFALTDAFLDRDKKRLWLLLTEAWGRGESNEAIAGLLFWQIKILRLVERTGSPEEAGQKPFVYNKAKRALTKFKKGELDRISRELLELYHQGHQGKLDMNLALERWILSI